LFLAIIASPVLLFGCNCFSLWLQIIFIYVDTAEENLAKPFLTVYGLESDKRPVIVSDILEPGLILYVTFRVNAGS
jgi:hypothetical protein